MASAMAIAGSSWASTEGPSSVPTFETAIPWPVMTRTAPLTIRHPEAPRKPPITG